MSKLRVMHEHDAAAAEEAWSQAFNAMRAAYGLPVEVRTAESIERLQARIRHLVSTDPEGSWVAENDDGHVIGVAQALVRDDLWVLSLLGVAPAVQERGVGKALLKAALGYGSDAAAGMILCSRDPRAMRRYSRAGFDLHPSVTARGQVDLRRISASSEVTEGGAGDLSFVDELGRQTRRGGHGRDIQHLLREGCQLWLLDGRGYAVSRRAKPVFLAAANEDDASQLLSTCLAHAEAEEVIEINWITAGQQWAVRTALQAGLGLHPVGPVMTRGIPGPPPCYLPSGAYG